MGAVRKTDIPQVSAFMTDFWEYVKAVWIIEDNDAYWDEVCQRAVRMLDKYKDEFCRGQILRFLDYLDAQTRGGIVNGKASALK